MSKSTYKAIDLLILSGISGGIEALIYWAYNSFGHYDGYIVSFIVVIGMIAMFRWNWAGIVVPIISGGVSVLMMRLNQDLSLGTMLANTLGYLPMLICLLWFKFIDKKKMLSSYGTMYGYLLSGYLLVDIGRTCFASIGITSLSQIADVLYSYVVWDLLNIVIGCVVFFVALKQKTLVYDMNTYLIEFKKENPTSVIRNEIDDYHSLESIAEDNDEVSDIALLDGGMLTTEDLKKMNETYMKMTNTQSKYIKEQQAIDDYHKQKDSKKDNTKENGGQAK